MNKKIIIGSVFAVLLMISMPMISNIQAEFLEEYENRILKPYYLDGKKPGKFLCDKICMLIEDGIPMNDHLGWFIIILLLHNFTPLDFDKCKCDICS